MIKIKDVSRLQGSMNILLVSTADSGGGAEISARSLFECYRRLGYECRMAVGKKKTFDPDVFSIPNDQYRKIWARVWIRLGNKLSFLENTIRGISRLRSILRWIGEPTRRMNIARGNEDFEFPATWDLLNLAGSPEIVHCFNLHPAYFDLRVLPWLSRQLPVILDLRDAWLLSGHCAHSFECDKWKTGCGQCPDLGIYPAIRRDATAFNWQRKLSIFSESRVYVATPCQWLMRKVEQSILFPAIRESRVIPTGIDLSVFHPYSKREARTKLRIPAGDRVILFTANGIKQNRWKDYQTMQSAAGMVSERFRQNSPFFIALGRKDSDDSADVGNIRFISHLSNPEVIADYYRAADVYVHASLADTFPRAVLEALACGTPVVATAVGGIPEQIVNLGNPNQATGILVPARDARAMAEGLFTLLANPDLCQRIGENAARDAARRFDLNRQADAYLDWYAELCGKRINPKVEQCSALQ